MYTYWDEQLGSYLLTKEHNKLKEIDLINIIGELENGSPCDVCKFNPPSSCDGKPCTMCPAEATERFKDKLENGYFRKRREK